MSMKQRGDTIIEVLMAMTVIGIVLGASFGIANRSVATGRNAQERGEALKIAETQIELLKIAYQANSPASVRTTNTEFCLNSGASGVTTHAMTESVCSSAGSAGIFRVAIVGSDPLVASGPNTSYKVTITWQALGTASASPSTLTLSYRPGVL